MSGAARSREALGWARMRDGARAVCEPRELFMLRSAGARSVRVARRVVEERGENGRCGHLGFCPRREAGMRGAGIEVSSEEMMDGGTA